MTFLPSVVQAEHRGDFRLRVVFNDGSENTIDFARWLEEEYVPIAGGWMY